MSYREDEFIRCIYKEKENTQNERTKLVLTKLGLSSVVLSIASLVFRTDKFDLSYLLLVAPFISIVFDYYIAGSNASIKKIGMFIRTDNESSAIEKRWEKNSTRERDKYAPIGSLIFSSMITAFSALLFFIKGFNKTKVTGFIFLGIFIIQIVQHLFFANKIRKLDGRI